MRKREEVGGWAWSVAVLVSILLLPGAASLATAQVPAAAEGPVGEPPEAGVFVGTVTPETIGANRFQVDLGAWVECQPPSHYAGSYEVELRLEPGGQVEAVEPSNVTLVAEFPETGCKAGSNVWMDRVPISLDLAPEVTAYTNLSLPFVMAPADGGEPTEGTVGVPIPRVGSHAITPDPTYRETDDVVPIHVSVHNTYNAPLEIDLELVGPPVNGDLTLPGDRVLPPVQSRQTEDVEDVLVLRYGINDRGLDSFSIRVRASVLGPDGYAEEILLEQVFEIRLDTDEGWIESHELEPIREHSVPGVGAWGVLGAACSVARVLQGRFPAG